MVEVTAGNVFKEAFAVAIIKEPETYNNMILSRNMLSHCYDSEKFKFLLGLIKLEYLPALADLHEFFIVNLPTWLKIC